MKKGIKNIIMICILFLILGLTYLTMNYAKNNISANNTAPNMGENMGQPPEKPSGDENAQKGNSDGEDIKQPDNQEGNADITKPDDENDSAELTKPDDDGNGSNMPNDNKMMPDEMKKNENKLTIWYYVIFAACGIIIGLIIMYLILSNFNAKSMKEVFINKDKIVIYVLSVVLFSVLFTFGSKCIIENYFLSSNSVVPNMLNNQGEGNVSYSAVKEITEDEDITNEEFNSKNADENAIMISKSESKLDKVIVSKTGDSDGGDSTSFYGYNSAILAKDGASVVITDSEINTSAAGANGVFSYGGSAQTNNSSSDGTSVTISDSKITTTSDNSGGIMTTGGGIMNANNLTINTSGTSSAAIRTDRGGGTVTVNKGTYTTTGTGSPSIYSTADITVKNATLISKASEGIVIEGKNSVKIENTTLVDTNNKLNGQSTTYKNIFLYQSMSGDAASGKAEFTATSSDITTNKGDTFYVTNTTAEINLNDNKITNNDKTGNFLRIQKDSWGNSGSNGGDVVLNLTKQSVTGDIVLDEISTLEMNMEESSYFEGKINTDNTAKNVKLTISKNSSIKLTGNTYVTSLENADKNNSNIDFNGYKLYVNDKAIN
jgi:hypothetical protein